MAHEALGALVEYFRQDLGKIGEHDTPVPRFLRLHDLDQLFGPVDINGRARRIFVNMDFVFHDVVFHAPAQSGVFCMASMTAFLYVSASATVL